VRFRLDDYIDGDVAYLAGLVIGRGVLSDSPMRTLVIRFPYTNLKLRVKEKEYDQEHYLKLGLNDIRERIAELLACDIRIEKGKNSIDLVAMFQRHTMAWRNILLLTNGAKDYHHFAVPQVFFEKDLPTDWKAEFIKGFGDVAGNIRESNLGRDGRHRVRLDVLNSKTNWTLPVQLCTLLQEHVGIPVQLITWGHPNLGREFREHQMNIFADSYLHIGFSFEHKQEILSQLAKLNSNRKPYVEPHPCPGQRLIRELKDYDKKECDVDHLDPSLVGRHFDAYWQICRALGCPRRPPPDLEPTLDFVEEG